MIRIRKICLPLALALMGGLAWGQELSEGDKLDVLETRNGRKFEKVTIRGILPEGLKIMHSTGTTTIPAADLPQYRKLFAAVQPAPVAPQPAAPPPQETDPAAWQPKTNADVADCSLFVRVTRGTSTSGEEGSWEGSAFLCNHGKSTYIYSNAHNFDGASDFSIVDSRGKAYTDFESVEIATDGQALWKETGYGGDIVRIKLRTPVEKALTMSPEVLGNDTAKGRKILVTGNTGGRGAITQLEGIITSIADNQIIKHNAATEPGNSGSPIVDFANHKVIGILTWGLKLPDPLVSVWSKQPVESREGINFGAALATVRFEPTTFAILEQQRLVMNQLKKNVRLFGLLDTLIPAKQGLFVDKNVVVMGDYTVADLLAESADHPVVRELMLLDRFLTAKSRSKIAMNNQVMLKRYVETYRICCNHASAQRKALENSTAATFFMKCHMKRSHIIDVCRAYEALSARSLDWYVKQLGTGGQSLPLDQRYRLPSMRSGLKGLGIQEK